MMNCEGSFSWSVYQDDFSHEVHDQACDCLSCNLSNLSHTRLNKSQFHCVPVNLVPNDYECVCVFKIDCVDDHCMNVVTLQK